MPLQGEFSPTGDKSISHRLILFSLLAKGRCQITNLSTSADVETSLMVSRSLGLKTEKSGNLLHITGAEGRLSFSQTLDCNNSGTTIRLLLGVLAGQSGGYVLTGDGSLRRRPMERVAIPLRQMGAEILTSDGFPPVSIIGGMLKGITYKLPVASAQLKSAILLAGVQAEGITEILESQKSRDHTERLLRTMGADLRSEQDRLLITKSELCLPERFLVPGDISSAAFFICSALIIPGSRVVAKNVLLNPTRSHFLTILKRMGGKIFWQISGEGPEPFGIVTAEYSPDLMGTKVSAEEIPLIIDEIPILSLVAALAQGRSIFCDVHELTIKESNRLQAIVKNFSQMSIKANIEGNDLIIDGPNNFIVPDQLDSYSDHRIAMTLRLAAVAAEKNLNILGEESIKISYPEFHSTLEDLR